MSELSVVILAGGISHERDVSLRSGRRVAEALQSVGMSVELLDPDAELLPRLAAQRPDVVFPAVHGASGEDGALLGLLEALGIPTVGSQSASAQLAWSKPIARNVVAAAGISVPAGLVLSREAFRELSASSVLGVIDATAAFPLVVKPGKGGSAQGVSMVDAPEQLPRALVEAFSYADTALCERRIFGTELAVTVVDDLAGLRALPAVEIEPLHGSYDFEARYNAGETRFYAPARLSEELAVRVSDAATRAHVALGLRDVSRIDLIVDGDGAIWFLEANVIPGMTETSLLPLALDAAGLDHGEFYAGLIQSARARS